jgi:cytochrome c oxidase subunit 2
MTSHTIDAVDPARRKLVRAAGAFSLTATASVLVGAQDAEVRIAVVARKFEFVPDEIQVRRGDRVVLKFSAPDVAMGFALPAFKLRTDIVPGQVAELRFTADHEGRFDFVCDQFCGSGHEDMNGTLVVTPG